MSRGRVEPAVPRSLDVVFPRRERVEDRRKDLDQRKLLDEFFDHGTLLAVSRLVNQGAFDILDHPISSGKEGGVFRASKGTELRAVKIYRISNTMFRRLPPYALEELRREASLRNYGGLIFAWTRREHTVLGRLAEAGVRSPRPYAHYRNVLVMEFIGDAAGAAPRLKDVPIDAPAELYEQLVDQFGRMIRGAKLVHGDLSPYNTLYHDGRVVIIDVAQSVRVEHPQARQLLERDLVNFSKFLGRAGYSIEPTEFFEAVGGAQVGAAPREA